MKLMQKRVLLPLLAAVFLSAVLAACGSAGQNDSTTQPGADVVGLYQLQHISAAGLDLDAGTLNDTMGTQISIQLEVKADGTFVLDSSMPELNRKETISGTWSQTDGALTFATDSETLPVTLAGSQLTLEQDGQSLIFERS